MATYTITIDNFEELTPCTGFYVYSGLTYNIEDADYINGSASLINLPVPPSGYTFNLTYTGSQNHIFIFVEHCDGHIIPPPSGSPKNQGGYQIRLVDLDCLDCNFNVDVINGGDIPCICHSITNTTPFDIEMEVLSCSGVTEYFTLSGYSNVVDCYGSVTPVAGVTVLIGEACISEVCPPPITPPPTTPPPTTPPPTTPPPTTPPPTTPPPTPLPSGPYYMNVTGKDDFGTGGDDNWATSLNKIVDFNPTPSSFNFIGTSWSNMLWVRPEYFMAGFGSGNLFYDMFFGIFETTNDGSNALTSNVWNKSNLSVGHRFNTIETLPTSEIFVYMNDEGGNNGGNEAIWVFALNQDPNNNFTGIGVNQYWNNVNYGTNLSVDNFACISITYDINAIQMDRVKVYWGETQLTRTGYTGTTLNSARVSVNDMNYTLGYGWPFPNWGHSIAVSLDNSVYFPDYVLPSHEISTFFSSGNINNNYPTTTSNYFWEMGDNTNFLDGRSSGTVDATLGLCLYSGGLSPYVNQRAH